MGIFANLWGIFGVHQGPHGGRGAELPHFTILRESLRARILCGGDMCNILAQYGLAAASSNHPCPVCIVPKTLFSKIFFQPDLLRDCNNGVFARTRGNILAEAAKSNRSFGVKRPPLSPLPLDLEAPLISVILYCSLHGVLRIVSAE